MNSLQNGMKKMLKSLRKRHNNNKIEMINNMICDFLLSQFIII